MDKLKKLFLKIQGRFLEKKSFFNRKLERWNKRGKIASYKQGKLLFDEASQCEREISTLFESPDWKYNRAFIKVKMQALDGLLRELDILTQLTWLKWVKATVVVVAVVFLLRNFVFGIYHVPTSSAETTLLVGDRVLGNKLVYLYESPKVGDIVMFEDPTFVYPPEGSTVKRLWQKYIGITIGFLGLQRGPQYMAKRVIAGPGDVIEGKIEDGIAVVYRNGKPLNEPYTNKYPLIALKKTIGLVESEKVLGISVPEFLRVQRKVAMYAYDPRKDFEEQPFYHIDYRNVLYDRKKGFMKTYKPGIPATNKEGQTIDVFGPLIVPEGKYWVMGDNRRNSVDSREWGFVERDRITGRASFVIWSLDSEEPLWIFELIKNPIWFISRVRGSRFFKSI